MIWTTIAVFVFYLSLVGWGYLVHSISQRWGDTEADIDFGMAGAYGLAALCVMGGVLNLLAIISSVLLLSLLGFGLVIWAMEFAKDLRSHQFGDIPLVRFLMQQKLPALVLFAVLMLTVAGSGLPPLSAHDDYHGYLVFPHQMLEIGQLQPDPFNERRSGELGGQSFLNAMMLSLVSHLQVGAMDRGVGWLLLIGLVLGHGLSRRVPALVLFSIAILVHLFPTKSVNLSSYLTSAVLFFAFMRSFTANGTHSRCGEIFKTALLVAGLCSLKTTAIAGLAFIGPAAFLIDHRIGLAQRIFSGLKVTAVALLLLSPWMIAMYQSSGTLLFPLLGSGTHTAPEQGAAPLSVSRGMLNADYLLSLTQQTLLLPGVAAGMMLLLLGGWRSNSRGAATIFVMALLAALALSTVSLGLYRYNLPILIAAYLFLLLEWNVQTETARRHWATAISLLLFVAMLGASGISRVLETGRMVLAGTAGQLLPFPRKILQAAQDVVPPSKPMLAVLSHPYLLNFSRNPVYIVDHAGSGGPDGGLPVHDSAEVLARYLRKQDIIYLVYSYSDEGGYGLQQYGGRLNYRGLPYFDRTRILAENNFKLHAQILELTNLYPVVYDDEYSLVLCLGNPPIFSCAQK